MEQIERPFMNRIIREKNRYIRKAADYAARHRSTSTIEFLEHRDNMREILERYYKTTIATFTTETASMIDEKNHIPQLERKALWEELFSSFVSLYAGEKAQMTADTTRIDIQRAISKSLEQPDGVNERDFVKRILQVRGLSRFRANTIARTETHAAAMYASIETAKTTTQELGIERKKEWIAALDERTRMSHAAANEQTVGLNDNFVVNGESLDRPADPVGSAGNIINCRCVMVYV